MNAVGEKILSGNKAILTGMDSVNPIKLRICKSWFSPCYLRFDAPLLWTPALTGKKPTDGAGYLARRVNFNRHCMVFHSKTQKQLTA
jgi:hypothetical protein